MKAPTTISTSPLVLMVLLVGLFAGRPTWAEPIAVLAPPLAPPELEVATPDEPGRCADRDPLRKPLFGDLHVHSTLSLDAATQGTRNRPRDAYRFARGEKLGIQPYDGDVPLREVQLERPLDFAAVTDHAELFGELHICRTPGAEGYDSTVCTIYRRWPRLAFFLINGSMTDGSTFSFCGEDAALCLKAARGPWEETITAAEEAYDRSPSCQFTSLIAYEWTAAPETNNLHRNVIFGNATVPELPISSRDARRVRDLWDALARECDREKNGCEALIIPHNSNLSGGVMFAETQEDGSAFSTAYANRRAEMEPLVELSQHKGDSECRIGVGTRDEFCDFELLPYGNFGGKFAEFQNVAPGEGSFVRNALKKGLLLEKTLGTNPFRMGVISSTDTHLGTPGAVREDQHPGHGGAGEPSSVTMPRGLPDDIDFNPGGLAVVWAEENSRESIFEALRRRETYSTTGPRMKVRFFGGWNYPDDLCGQAGFVRKGYQGGTPMGGVLPPPQSSAPRFAIQALRDSGGLQTPLERIQIIKGWLDASGEVHEKVYEVAGRTDGLATVDPTTCATEGPGADQLCQVWTDPDFDAGQAAFWYARVMENPTCRWQSFICNAAGVDCDLPATIGEGFAPCCDTDFPRTIRERAVTSPIWFVPEPAPEDS